jgi:hypothetical protein
MSRVAHDDTASVEVAETRVPRPYPGGSYPIQSLGRWVDRFMGDRKARADAAARLEPFLMRAEDGPAEPEPASIPEPVPGGSEPITKGDAPRR